MRLLLLVLVALGPRSVATAAHQDPARCSAPACADVGEGWLREYDAALARAREEGKDVLLHFTGSDWCSWCTRLDEEVLRARGWRERAAREFVLVSLDFPRGQQARDAVPDPERNDQVAREFGVTGYPSVLLLTPDGEVLGRTGYRKGGADAYWAHLEQLRDAGHAQLEEVQVLVDRLDGADVAERPEVLAELRSQLLRRGLQSPGARRLQGAVARSFELDPDGALGLARPALRCFLELSSVDLVTLRAAQRLDASNADGLFERALRLHIDQVRDRDGVLAVLPIIDAWDATGKVHEAEDAFYVCLLGAWWNEKQAEDPARAEHFARRGLALEVGDPKQRRALGDILGTGR